MILQYSEFFLNSSVLKYLARISEKDFLTSTSLILINSIPSPLGFTLFSSWIKDLGDPMFSLIKTEEAMIGLSNFCLMIVLSWRVLILYSSNSSSIKGMQSGLPTGGICAGSPMHMILVFSLLSTIFSNKSSLSIETSSIIRSFVELMAGLNPPSWSATNSCLPSIVILSFRPSSL